jgi:hypothetical protein
VEGLGCIEEIDLWIDDCPDSWLPFMKAFLHGGV